MVRACRSGLPAAPLVGGLVFPQHRFDQIAELLVGLALLLDVGAEIVLLRPDVLDQAVDAPRQFRHGANGVLLAVRALHGAAELVEHRLDR